ncbi:uncharacterized protein VP01_362g19 [Puccinia sorghi]|uniref:GAG-pre-integrase domain-containing protein n=1 Tax=Puccinia sorghi TaxID=27349 RepID=A0A0L6UVJ4_9BASI|nr:uncharacterized protein VP01_362g19 [Puccinia sorghi]
MVGTYLTINKLFFQQQSNTGAKPFQSSEKPRTKPHQHRGQITSNLKSQQSGHMVELGEDVEDKSNLPDQPSSEHALVENFQCINPILYTGVSQHITGNLKFLSSSIHFSNPVPLKTAINFDCAFVVGSGDLTFEGTKTNVFFHTLLCQIIHILLDLCLFLHPMHAMLPFLHKNLNLSRLHSKQAILYWHCIMGHAGLRTLRKMITNNSDLNLPKSLPAGEIKFPVCVVSKSVQYSKLLSTQRNPECLEIFALDLIGPMEVTSFGISKYVLTFCDTETCYGEAHLLAENSDTALVFIKICRRLETQTNKKIQSPLE